MINILHYFGIKEYVALGSQSYGCWIVYENNQPKYDLGIFDYTSKSSILILAKLNNSNLTVDQLVKTIGDKQGLKLTTGRLPFIRLKIGSNLKEIDIVNLPYDYVRHYEKFLLPPWNAFPGKNPSDLFWKRGKGKEVLTNFRRCYNLLEKSEKIRFEKNFNPPGAWDEFY